MRHWFLWRREAVEYLHGYPRWDEALVQERGSKVVMGTGFGALDDRRVFWAGQAIFQGETERWFIVPILLIFDELTLRSDWVILWRGEALVTWNLKQAGDTNRRSGFERRGWQESFPLYAGLNKRAASH